MDSGSLRWTPPERILSVRVSNDRKRGGFCCPLSEVRSPLLFLPTPSFEKRGERDLQLPGSGEGGESITFLARFLHGIC